jgi:hypothetical protein
MEGLASSHLPSYTREDYPRIQEIMIDSDLLPATYDSWLECIQTAAARWERAGILLRFWRVEPAAFLAWCEDNECHPDGEARLAYAESLAMADLTAACEGAGPLPSEHRALSMTT